ncbi:hypothetical protein PrebiDRAFT_0390 [Prevotella bivia DSM 20514]|uniref:Uncharacterized protein n=1 Tax=Prevotella bivia DSM 20514 TaxID=868129 RepID=I4Z7G2_9BACT|nr:hypothetical protein PrebiDRAFT_0390 [Prevotella bivia DSM 20514]
MLSKKVSNFLSNHSFFRNFDTLIGINSISKDYKNNFQK